MRLAILLGTLVLICGVYAENSEDERFFPEIIAKAIIKCIQNKLNKGDPQLGVPSFAPLDIKDEKIDLNLPDINGKISIKKIFLERITEWVIKDMKLALKPPINLMAKFEFPNITLDAEFITDLNIFNKKISGTSVVLFYFDAFKFNIDVIEVPDEEEKDKIWLTPSITTDFNEFKFEISELLVDGEDISPLINALGNSVPNYFDAINYVLEYLVMVLLNEKNINPPSTYGVIDIIKGLKEMVLTCIPL